MRKIIITNIFIMGILYLPSSVVALDYDPTYPPTLFPNKIIIEKGYEAFQFIGKDLLIPDKVEYNGKIYEIVQAGEEDRFKVDFQEGISGKIMARVTLYQDKPEPLEEIKETLKSLKTEIQRLQDNIKEGPSEISKKISEVKEKSDSLQMKVASIENTHQNQAKEIQTIRDDLQDLESRVNSILK